ncbi:MAG TPA: hypothetical protein VJT14_05750 [Candidatus Dormibacteraeota bacterium]|nr:hypothetical protein [Candidatus Dormibacteraeota bacterium]
MFNLVEPTEQPSGKTRRRLSIGRVLYWSFLLGIPLAGGAGGSALLVAANELDAAVQTYRNATPCRGAVTTATCYTTVTGTLAKFSVTHGKTGDTADMTLQLRDGTRSTWAKTNWQQEDALHVGAPIQAEFYQGAITAVYLGAIGIETKDSPIYKQSDLRLGAVLIPTLGLIIAMATFITMRGQKQATVGSLVAIDTTLPIAEQEALLRHALLQDPPAETPSVTAGPQPSVTLPFTLRPHPMPTRRPWWVGLIALGLGVPSFVLRMRTPGPIAEVVLGATVATIVAAVAFHWRYRNGRRTVVDDFSVRRVSLLGAVRVVSRSDVARLACPNIMTFGMASPERRLLLLDASGRCLLALPRYYSTEGEATQFAAALRVPLDNELRSSLTTPSRLRRTVPGAVSWSEAHPFLMTIMLILPILVALGLFVWMLNGFK